LLPVLIQALLLASAGLLSAGSITLVILLLISDRGWHNGLGYALGYTIAYTVIGVSAVVLGYRATGNYSRVVTPKIQAIFSKTPFQENDHKQNLL
jgi:ABC-type sulfate transport system permease component